MDGRIRHQFWDPLLWQDGASIPLEAQRLRPSKSHSSDLNPSCRNHWEERLIEIFHNAFTENQLPVNPDAQDSLLCGVKACRFRA